MRRLFSITLLSTIPLLLFACATTSGSARTCQIDRPCPPATRLATCDEETLKTALDVVAFDQRANTLVDQTVTVHGRVQLTSVCTLLGCLKSRCCNRCDGGATLDLKLHNRRLPLDGIRCSGDETRVCCSLDLKDKQQIVVRGVLKRQGVNIYGPTYALKGATLCRPKLPLPEPARPFQRRIGCYFARDREIKQTGLRRDPAAVITDTSAILSHRLLASEWIYHNQPAAWKRLDPELLVSIYTRSLGQQGYANRWGHLWVNGDPGCLGERLIALGRSAVAPLITALSNTAPMRYEGAEEARMGNAQSYTVRDFAAFYLNQLCKLGFSRQETQALSTEKIGAIRRLARARCPAPK